MPLVARGYGAYISCDGQELKVYQAKVEDKAASCYILSIPGKEYRVHWVDSMPPTHLSLEVRVDGRRIGVVSHTRGSSKASTAGLRITLDAHDLSHAAPHDALPSAFSEEVGTVEVRLRRVRDFVAVPIPSKAVSALRTTKGSTASIAAGKRQGAPMKPQKPATVLRPILIDDRPHVVFRFMYRTQDYLEANGIVNSGTRTLSKSIASMSKGQRKKRASETFSVKPIGEPPSKRRRQFIDVQGPSTSSHEPYPDDDMYLDIPQDIDIGSGVEAAPIEAVGNLGQSSESSSTARNAIQPIGHVDGSDDEDERMVEMHLSPCKGLSQPEGDIGRLPNVKTEAAKPALHIKREPAHDAAIPIQTDAEPPAGENYEAEETVVEIHVNSKNQRALFGAPVPDRIVKKEEENDQPLVTDDTGGYLVKTEEEESTVVEVHLSAANLQEAFTGLTSVSVKQEHVKEES